MRLDEYAIVAWWQAGCVSKRKISFVNRLVFSSKVDNGCHNVRHIAYNVENVSNARAHRDGLNLRIEKPELGRIESIEGCDSAMFTLKSSRVRGVLFVGIQMRRKASSNATCYLR